MNQQLYWQIHKLAFLLEKRADEALKDQLGIGFAQFKVLEAINQNSLARQNTVAEMLDQTEASISRQIKILQKKGLINASSVMGNKRAKELSLTRVGDDVVRQAKETVNITNAQIVERLNSGEQQVILELMQRMIEQAKSNEI